MRMQFKTILVVAGLALTTACTGGAAASGVRPDPATAAPASGPVVGAQQVTVVTHDTMRFEPSSITVMAGQPVQLTLKNEGRMPHDFTLSEGAARRVKVKANGGETASGTFTIERPGTYTFVCSIPGHEAAGMKGTITAR